MSDERLDRVIDQVAREMTEGTLPGDFRARVVARIATNDERRTTTHRVAWLLAPVAAAAIVVAIFLWRGTRESAPVVAHPQPQPAAVARALTPKDPPAGDSRPAPQRDVDATSKRRPRDTVAPRAIDPSEVEALAPAPIVAPSIAIRTLTTDPLALEELESPARIAIAPLATPEGERP